MGKGGNKTKLPQVVNPATGESTRGSDSVRSPELARVASGSRTDSGACNLRQDSESRRTTRRKKREEAKEYKEEHEEDEEEQQPPELMETEVAQTVHLLQVPNTLANGRRGSASSVGSQVSMYSNLTEVDYEFLDRERQKLKKMRTQESELFEKIEAELDVMHEACRVQTNVNAPTKKGIVNVRSWIKELQELRQEREYEEDCYSKSAKIANEAARSRKKTRDRVKEHIQGKLLHEALKAAHNEAMASAVGSPKRGRSPETSPHSRKRPKTVKGPASGPPSNAGPDDSPWVTVGKTKRAKKNKEKKREESKKKEETKKKEEKRTKRRATSPAPTVLIKVAEGKTFADVLRKIRKDSDLVKEDASVTGTTTTEKGNMLVRLRKGSDRRAFAERLKASVGDAGTVEPGKRVTVEIKDLDTLTTEEDILEAMEEHLELTAIGEVPILGPNRRGQKTAIMQLREEDAKKILQLRSIKVGITHCRIRRRVEVLRCYRCLAYGHRKEYCSGEDRSKCCYKCGSSDHRKRECANEERCFLCPDGNNTHVAGGRGCGIFREALERARARPDTRRDKMNRRRKKPGTHQGTRK